MTRTPFVDGAWDFWKLYDAGEWEPETKAVLERFLQPGDLFVDIGAWIGPVSLWALERGATVVALEPDPVAYVNLCSNLRDREGWKAYKTALGSVAGTGQLAPFGAYGDSQSRLADHGEPCKVITPAGLLEALPDKPALVKLDVEGGELEVLPGLLAWGVPLYISWHQPWWADPVSEEVRRSWFEGFELTPIREDGWTDFAELLAVP